MKAAPREVARRVLARVEGGSYATLALGGELERSHFTEEDRALTTELVYGVLRQRGRLDRALASHAPRGLPSKDQVTLDALRLAAYQILFTRIPGYAAVNDAVQMVKRLRSARQAGFVNAVLRRLLDVGEPPRPADSDALRNLAEDAALAPVVLRSLIEQLGESAAIQALAALNNQAPLWLRAHTLRASRAQLTAELQRERPGIELLSSPLAPDALAVIRGSDLFTTAAYARGTFVAQDLGAQLAVLLVNPRPGEHILDACAGVGGKSTYLAALARDQAHIDAVDLSSRKLELAADHAHRLGLSNLRFVQADLTQKNAPIASTYDRILLDAPCSGLGVLRRHPELKWRVTPELIAQLCTLQAQLLDAMAPRLRPGGLMVYTVCTFTNEEGPQQIERFLMRHAEFKLEPVDPLPHAKPDGLLHSWPHLHQADAFFAARLRKIN